MKPKLPKCETCGTTANVQAAPRPGTIPGSHAAARWVCGDCLYREDHDAAALLEQPKRAKLPQAETLW